MEQQIAQQTELMFTPIVTVDGEVLCNCGLTEGNRVHNMRKSGPHHVFSGEAYGARFHRRNPQVMDLLVKLAREAKIELQTDHVGFRMIWERARYCYLAVLRDGSGYRLNNNAQAWYSRALMERYPDLAGTFHTRERAA